MIDFTAIQVSSSAAFHMVRHFEQLSARFEKQLNDMGYADNQIQEAHMISGSRFFSAFAGDTETLFHQLNHYPHEKTVGINGHHIIISQVSEKAFPKGIGTVGIESIDKIEPLDRKNIIYKKNRGYKIGHFSVDKLPVTNTCIVIVKAVSNGYSLVTAFSGDAAMPIPNYKMNKTQFNACKAFWSNHVFLENKIIAANRILPKVNKSSA